jgi:hypothetical protein
MPSASTSTWRATARAVAAIGVGDDVVGRVQLLAAEVISEHGHRAVVLVAHDSAGEMLAGELSALEVERVAVRVVGRRAEYGNATVVLRPSHLPIIGDVAPQQITALRAPGRAFGPQQSGIEALDRRIRLGEVIERRIDRDDVGIPEVGRRRNLGTNHAYRMGQ